jgi:serine/threonine protein kinase
LKTIQIHSSLSTNILLDFQNVTTIEIETKPIAEGAFGEVYICKSVNGKSLSVPQVIKLFKEDNQNRQDHNFNTVQKLQRKIEAKNQQIKVSKQKNITDEYPSLKGIPQFSFEGSINGKKYRGFSSTNLKRIGFEEFIDILDKPNLYKSYQRISIDKKMLIAFHLASGFKLLQEIFFIHADLKPEAIFINTKSNECAIIDFDSGTITENPNDTPNTWGAPNDWVAPEIWEQLKQIGAGGLQQVKVNLLSDLWSVAVGIHYILTTTHPLFYLNELSPRVTKQYFSKYKWPEIQQNEPYFNKGNKNIYLPVKNWLEKTLPKQIYTQLYNTVNYGYSNPTKRTTYNEWEKVLTSVQESPVINEFSLNVKKIVSGQKAILEWSIENATSINIYGIGSVKSVDKTNVSPSKTTTFKIIAENAFGKSEKELLLEVIPAPKIKIFKTNKLKLVKGEETELIWEVENIIAVDLLVDGKKKKVAPIGKINLNPITHTTYTLELTALDGKTKSKHTAQVEVYDKGAIKKFTTDRHFILPIIPVTLSWEVEHAKKVTLEGFGEFQLLDSLEVRPDKDTLYKLIVEDEFGVFEEYLQVRIIPLPIIESIFVPAPKISEELKIEIDLPQFPNINLAIAEIKNGISLDTSNLKMEIPRFNTDEIEHVSLINSETKTNFKFNLKPLLSKVSELNNKLFKKHKIS